MLRSSLVGQGGLSLAEVLAVLALVGVVLAAALPMLLPTPVAVEAAARELAVDLNLARQLAVSRQQPHLLEFGPPGAAFVTYTVRPESGQDEPGFPKTLPAGVVVSGPGFVTFLSSGAARLAGEQADWTLASGTESATVRVWAQTGYARVLP